jgi:hypothetical protein
VIIASRWFDLTIRPQLLLVPEFTEIQWTIKPQLEEWAEVASYDPPGVGAEPEASEFTRRALLDRGLAELERLGWERFFVVADGWSLPTGVEIASERSAQLAGLVLTHASLTHSTEGGRPSVSPEVYAGITQLIRQDARAFIRHGITQVTGGSVDANWPSEYSSGSRPATCWRAGNCSPLRSTTRTGYSALSARCSWSSTRAA